jgi:hypothetical protein
VKMRDAVLLADPQSPSGIVKVPNPADDVGPASIATFVPKDRSLSPTEIRIMLKQLEKVATLPTIRLGIAAIAVDP